MITTIVLANTSIVKIIIISFGGLETNCGPLVSLKFKIQCCGLQSCAVHQLSRTDLLLVSSFKPEEPSGYSPWGCKELDITQRLPLSQIKNAVLVSGVQKIQLYMYMYLFFFKFFSHLGYYIILNRFPCAIQQALVDYPFSNVCMSISNSLTVPPPPQQPFCHGNFVLQVCESVSVL